MPLSDVIATYRRWQYMPDADDLLVTLGTYAANRLPGDPVWLFHVGPPSSGKTEKLVPLARLEDVRLVSTLTEASLLSGTAKKETSKAAKGGLLREVGTFGVILMKDFGSILSMHRDSRAAVLAALREVYDGQYTRCVGTDGGRTLSWQGKVGLLAAVTPTLDRHHAVMATMGERFVAYRLGELDPGEMVYAAMRHQGRESEMRRELADTTRDLFGSLDLETPPAPPSTVELAQLLALAVFVARTRAPVEREGHSREVELVPGAEAPTRIAKSLRQLLEGLRRIGAGEEAAWRVVRKVAGDCIPRLRWLVFEVMAGTGCTLTTVQVAHEIGYPTTTTKRALEDLTCYGLFNRTTRGKGYSDEWTLTELGRRTWEDAFGKPEVSEKGNGASKPEVSQGSLLEPEHTFDDLSGLLRTKEDAPWKH